MEVIDGVWIMKGLDFDDPRCLHDVDELVDVINDIGFLPLFSNGVEGFSVEEMTYSDCWWCGDEEIDPWEWRAIIAREEDIAYGKFFNKKAGFISKNGCRTLLIIEEMDMTLMLRMKMAKQPIVRSLSWICFCLITRRFMK